MEAHFLLAQSYVGMPYLPGAFDCADLAVRVQWEVFGQVIALPQNRDRPRGVRGQAREVAKLREAVARRRETPVTGCGVLLEEPDPAGGAAVDLHIGTVFLQQGTVWVLHNSQGMQGAALQRLADLQRFGLRVEGFYDWICT